MNLNKINISCKFYCFIGVFIFFTNTGYAQDTTYVDIFDFFDTNRVQWVDQIPRLKEDTKKQKKGWFKRIVLGKEELTTFQKPVQVIATGNNNSIVLDQGNGTIFFAKDDKLDIPKLLRKQDSIFPSLVAACLLPNNDLLFTDSKLNNIYVLSEDKKNLHQLNEHLNLERPTGIAYSKKTDQIWVVETAAHQINILNRKGEPIKTFGSRGIGKGEFNYPTSIWIDKNGTAYVVDTLNYRIQIFDAEGNFIFMFGENGNGTGFLASPKGIATDSYGHIYVVDILFHGVQIFDDQGNYLYQFGTQGRDKGEFWMPSGIFIDSRDHIYVADSYNKRIQIYQLVFTK